MLEQAVSAYDLAHDSLEVSVIYKETEELRSGFQAAALAGLGPDLIFGPSDQVGPFATMGFVRPLDDAITRSRSLELDDRALVKFKGHTYQLADRVGNHLTLVYNKQLVAKPPESTAELILVGKELTKDTDGDGNTDQWALVWNFTEPFFFIPWLSGYGGWVLDGEGKPSLNTGSAANAFRFVKSLRDEHKIVPPDVDYNTADAMFKEGRAAMIINGPWAWAGYAKAGIDYGLARIPKITSTGKWPAPMVSPLGYSICANTKGRELAATIPLLEYLISDSVQLMFVDATGIIPSSLVLRADSTFLSRPNMAESLAQLEVGKAMPIVPELRAVWDALRPAYQNALNGVYSPAEAAREAQALAETKIREMYE